jgi:hypothetical protein
MPCSLRNVYSSPQIPTINHPTIVELGEENVLGPRLEGFEDPPWVGRFVKHITEYQAPCSDYMGIKYAPSQCPVRFNDHVLKMASFLSIHSLSFELRLNVRD